MTKRNLSLTILAGLLLAATSAGAVDQEAGGRILLANPTGDFGDATENLGIGLEGHWGVRPCPRLTIGIGASVMTYGSEERAYDLPLVEAFDLTTDNNMAGAFVFTQLRPIDGAVQPYLEARAGFNYVWTESKLEDDDWWDLGEVARETNFDDFAGYVAGGGGLLLRVKDGGSEGADIFLDVKVLYQKGFEAEYLTEGDVEIVDEQPVYNTTRSDTDMMSYQLGVTVSF